MLRVGRLRLEDLRPVVGFVRVDAHETEAGHAVKGAGTKEDARAAGAPHQLFQQSGRAVEGKQGAGAKDEKGGPQRIARMGQLMSHDFGERLVFIKDGMQRGRRLARAT